MNPFLESCFSQKISSYTHRPRCSLKPSKPKNGQGCIGREEQSKEQKLEPPVRRQVFKLLQLNGSDQHEVAEC